MNILIVSSYLPFPLHSGGDVRLYNLIKRLKKKHVITLVCERRPYQTDDDTKEVEKFCHKVYTIPRQKQWSLSNILKASFSTKHSFLITGHTLPAMKVLLTDLLKENRFDIIHVETSYVFQNVPITSIPIVLVEHNLEYSVYERYAESAPLVLKKLLLLDVKKLEVEEKLFWKKAKKVLVVSQHDKKEVEKVVKEVSIVPNGVDTKIFTSKDSTTAFSEKEKKVLFIGNYNWVQNQHALKWILTDIWPLIEKKTDTSIKLWVVGRDLPSEFIKFASERVILQGVSNVPANEIFSQSHLLLAPLKVKGGTQYKILESMAVGTPVVTTELGALGLEIKDTKTILTGETSSEIVTETLKLLQDKDLYETLSKNGRKLVEEHFSFDAIAGDLDRVYYDVVAVKD